MIRDWYIRLSCWGETTFILERVAWPSRVTGLSGGAPCWGECFQWGHWWVLEEFLHYQNLQKECNSRQNFTVPLRVAGKKVPTENGLNIRPRSLHMSVCPDRGPEEGIKYSDPEMGNSTCMSYSIVRSTSKLVLLFLTIVGFCVHSLM